MKIIKYFFQFLIIIILFSIFKILGLRISSKLSGRLFKIIGPFFRSSILIHKNIKKALPDINEKKIKKISDSMWENYGRIFAEYIFLKNYRNDKQKIERTELKDKLKTYIKKERKDKKKEQNKRIYKNSKKEVVVKEEKVSFIDGIIDNYFNQYEKDKLIQTNDSMKHFFKDCKKVLRLKK